VSIPIIMVVLGLLVLSAEGRSDQPNAVAYGIGLILFTFGIGLGLRLLLIAVALEA
jgi:hypothetical protein